MDKTIFDKKIFTFNEDKIIKKFKIFLYSEIFIYTLFAILNTTIAKIYVHIRFTLGALLLLTIAIKGTLRYTAVLLQKFKEERGFYTDSDSFIDKIYTDDIYGDDIYGDDEYNSFINGISQITFKMMNLLKVTIFMTFTLVMTAFTATSVLTIEKPIPAFVLHFLRMCLIYIAAIKSEEKLRLLCKSE